MIKVDSLLYNTKMCVALEWLCFGFEYILKICVSGWSRSCELCSINVDVIDKCLNSYVVVLMKYKCRSFIVSFYFGKFSWFMCCGEDSKIYKLFPHAFLFLFFFNRDLKFNH